MEKKGPSSFCPFPGSKVPKIVHQIWVSLQNFCFVWNKQIVNFEFRIPNSQSVNAAAAEGVTSASKTKKHKKERKRNEARARNVVAFAGQGLIVKDQSV